MSRSARVAAILVSCAALIIVVSQIVGQHWPIQNGQPLPQSPASTTAAVPRPTKTPVDDDSSPTTLASTATGRGAGGALAVESTCQWFQNSRRLVLGFLVRNTSTGDLDILTAGPESPQMAVRDVRMSIGDCRSASATGAPATTRLGAGQSRWFSLAGEATQACLAGVTFRLVVRAQPAAGSLRTFTFDPFPEGLAGPVIQEHCVS